jgi:hypothetical protein
LTVACRQMPHGAGREAHCSGNNGRAGPSAATARVATALVGKGTLDGA